MDDSAEPPLHGGPHDGPGRDGARLKQTPDSSSPRAAAQRGEEVAAVDNATRVQRGFSMGGRALLAGVSLVLVASAAALARAPLRVVAGWSVAGLGLALAAAVATVALVAQRTRATVSAPQEARSLRQLLALPVLLLGVASILVSGGAAVVTAAAGARSDARAQATELASLAARLLHAHGGDPRLLATIAPPGGSARVLTGAAATDECLADGDPLPCAAQPLDDGSRLIVAVPPPPLSPIIGRLLVRAGALVLVLLLLASALARAAATSLDEAGAAIARGDEATPSGLPEPLFRAIAAARRAGPVLPPIEQPPAEKDLLDTVGSELRAPLDEIDQSTLDLDRLGCLAPDQIDDVALIRASTRELHQLVDAVLDLSSLQTRRIALLYAPVDLAALASDVGRSLRPQIEERSLTLHIDAPTTLPNVSGDARRLRQVLTNLLGNAVKFTEHGNITVTLAAEGDAIVLSVSDQGPGIPAALLPSLFQPYEQAGDARQRARGSGLGLAICQRLVEAHGGTITVESQPGAGATFRVRLPIVPPIQPIANPPVQHRGVA